VSTTSNPSWLGADPPLVCLAAAAPAVPRHPRRRAAPGLLWGLRHLPVIDHLGVHPHGVDWAPVAAAFIAAVAVLDPGMRPPPDCSQPEDGMAVGGDDITAVQEHPRDRPPVRDRERS
jgi:hypothetical protein